MSSTPTKDNKRDRVIDLYKEGKNMREIAKDVHMSFSVIGKIIRESNGQIEPKPEKLITTRAFSLFEQNRSLVQVTMELDLNPTEAEKIHESYLRLKGLDKVVHFCKTEEKHLVSFSEFAYACERLTPKSQKILDIMNLINLNEGLKNENFRLSILRSSEQKKINDLKQEQEAIKQSMEKLKQEESDRWYGLYGNGQY
jgi:hypothetical protein